MNWKLLKIWKRTEGTLMYSMTSYKGAGNVDEVIMSPTTERDLAKTIAWAKQFDMIIEDAREVAS